MVETGDTNPASFDPVAQFLQRLDDEPVRKLTGIDTTTQMAELLWLATHLEPPPPQEPAVERPDEDDDLVGDEGDRPPPPSESTPESESRSEDSPQKTDIDVLAPPPLSQKALPLEKALPPEVLPVQIFDPPMLGDLQGIVKALKPLLQKIDIGMGDRLNEPATVDFMARTDLCIPKLQPDLEAWFDVVVVVDRSSASMIIWQRLVDDIVRTLKRYGAFRDVRVYDLIIYPDAQPDQGEAPVMLRSRRHRPPHHPKELIDQQGRRLVILLSDTTAEHWWRGTVTATLEQWGHHMPVVLWQMLPPWLWQRTALGRGTPVSIRNAQPGVANQRWLTRASPQASPVYRQGQVAMPVVTSEAYDLTRWSQLVVGKPVVMPGFMLPLEGDLPRAIARPSTQTSKSETEQRDEAEQRTDRFLRLASPEAQRLLMLLAAAPVITLPIVRLIREEKLPAVTSPLPIAEIFTSGLVKRVTAPPQLAQASAAEDESPPSNPAQLAQDRVQYDFDKQVREALLAGKWLAPIEAVEVINSVSRAIEKRFNRRYPHTFQAYLKDPDIDLPEGLEGLKAFANITADILKTLGRPYQDLVQQLRIGAKKKAVPLDPYGNPLQTFTYEVAEYLNIPEIIDVPFTEGLLNDDTWPPALKSVDFEIATVEVTPGEPTGPTIEPFDFTIATLIHSEETNTWEINHQPGHADRYIETLPDGIPLEMVSIPGSSFVMGSPEDDPERDAECESLQHEASVSHFFMARYPITQVQWQVIAALPRVERDLILTPSRFSGADHPVENISWNDAVEFCRRISRLTGYNYQLPSEVEWEYSCRATTTTPYHFGASLIPRVANYGNHHGSTTEVGLFGIANGFGLCEMHGNVAEWCNDIASGERQNSSDKSTKSLHKPSDYRILRGGSWNRHRVTCRSAFRRTLHNQNRGDDTGFRVCFNL